MTIKNLRATAEVSKVQTTPVCYQRPAPYVQSWGCRFSLYRLLGTCRSNH